MSKSLTDRPSEAVRSSVPAGCTSSFVSVFSILYGVHLLIVRLEGRYDVVCARVDEDHLAA